MPPLGGERRGCRLQALWVGFVVCGLLLTQLGVRFGVEANVLGLLYAILVLVALLLGVVFYRRDVTDDLPKTKALVPILPIIPGIFRIMLLTFTFGLIGGIWMIRNDLLMILVLPLNAMFIWVAYIGDLSVLARRGDGSQRQSVRS